MRTRKIVDPAKRFWPKVDKKTPNDCWEWKTHKTRGYGVFSIRSKPIQAHRFSYELHFGKIPDGLLICHKCDNRACVNPNHLILGTHKDNTKDMMDKGRNETGDKHYSKRTPYKVLRGSQIGTSVLNEKQVMEIRNKFVPYKYSYRKLAKEYNVHRATVLRILQYKTWKHI